MKKILKIGILFLIVFALAVAAFAVYKLLKKDDAPKSDKTVFDRAPLDKDSVFGDYVFEEKVRDALNLGKEDKIDNFRRSRNSTSHTMVRQPRRITAFSLSMDLNIFRHLIRL